MKVPHDKFRQALHRFAAENIIPKINLPDENMKVLARFVAGSYIESKSVEIIDTMKQFVLVCDEDGEIDVDKTEVALMAGFKAAGNSVTLEKSGLKFTFKPEDWVAFKRYL